MSELREENISFGYAGAPALFAGTAPGTASETALFDERVTP